MNPDPNEERILNLERELADLRERFRALETHLTPPKISPAVRPEVNDLPLSQVRTVKLPPVEPKPVQVPSSAPPPLPRKPMLESSRAATPEDLEYKLGINGLLRGGAIVVFAALLFLVAVMISRGYVTPMVQFVGEIVLCGAFVSIGLLKRDVKEDFGQLLVGLGVAGLYASFAGAHLYKHLVSGETLVGLFVLLSLTSLGYAHWRASKSFLIFGVVGGFAGAMMPMRDSKVILDLCLHFLILIPGLAIADKNRWYSMSVGLWVVSSLALVPVLGSEASQWLRLGALFASSLAFVFAGGRHFRPSDFDRYGLLLGFTIFLTGATGLGIDNGRIGSWPVLALGAATVGVAALLPAKGAARSAVGLAALVTVAVIFPMGFKPLVAAYLFSGEAILLGFLAIRQSLAAPFWLGLASLGLSLIAFGVKLEQAAPMAHPVQRWAELLLLASWAGAVILGTKFALKRFEGDQAEVSRFLGAMALVGCFVRAGTIGVAGPSTGLSSSDSTLLGLAVGSLLTTIIAGRLQRSGLTIAAGLVAALAIYFSMLHPAASDPQALTLTVLILAGINATLGQRFLAKSWTAELLTMLHITFGGTMSILFVRFLQAATSGIFKAADENIPVYLGIMVLNIAWTVLAHRFRRLETAVWGWVSLVAASFVALTSPSGLPLPWLVPAIQVIALGSLCVMYLTRPKEHDSEAMLTVGCAVVGWLLSAEVFGVLLLRNGFGLAPVPAVTASWVIYAVALIVTGFRSNRRYLRYASLFVFGATIFKVTLYDLAALDSLVRVGILFLLGIGMIATGYWYILWDRKRSLETDELGGR